MTSARYAHAATTTNGFIYAAGGGPDVGQLESVEYAPINNDGSLGTWKLTSPLLNPRYQHKLVAVGGYIYAIGGSPRFGGAIDSVDRASVNPDGSLSSWAPVAPLPQTLTVHAAFNVANWIYVLGGARIGPSTPQSVLRSEVLGDGSLSAWIPESSMVRPRTYFFAAAAGGYAYAVGGLDSGTGTFFNSVEKAAINLDGSLGTWGLTSCLLTSRAHSEGAATSSYLYAVGGYDGLSNHAENSV
jgi:hypothetical protein